MPGGQPSTTQPIAGPWLSPKEVTQKSFPKVFPDIAVVQLAVADAAATAPVVGVQEGSIPLIPYGQNSIKFNDKFNIPLFTDGATRCQINPIPEK
jgi:hypothetical protein